MGDYEHSVFISYAWGGEREDIVNEIDETLQQRGIRIVRDKRALGYRGSIRDFMERIGRGSCIIVVISDKYLRSPNCMFELVEIAENKQFHDRVFPVVLSDANIYDPIKRIEYVKYWEAKRKELAKAMKTLDPANLQGIRDDMDQYDRIRDKISGITSILKDMNTLTSDRHRDSDFSDLYDAIVKGMEASGVISTAKSDLPAKKTKEAPERKAQAEISSDGAAAHIAEQKAASEQFETERQIAVKASTLLMQGKQLLEKKDWSGAAQIFRQVLTLIPSHAETVKLLSNAEAQIRQERESIARIIEQQNAENRSPQPDAEPGKGNARDSASTPVAPVKTPLVEEPETKLPAGTKSAEELPGAIRPPKIRFSRKSIIWVGTITSLLAVSGIMGAVMLKAGRNSSPISSVGMVQIPSGTYTIGENTAVDLDQFWIDRYEIKNSDYAEFIDETETSPPAYWTGGDIPAGLREHPVAQINWEEAKEYCSWAGKRLPTEAEWEIAARGPFRWKYPWGNDPDSVRQETQSTRPVNSNPANQSFYGAYFMSGNVWEWVDHPFTQTAENEHVMRGGAYGPLDVLTTAIPVPDDGSANEKMGFRCAASGESVTRQYDKGLALDDDFDNNNTNWPAIHEDEFLFDYHEVGFYHVEAREANKFIPAFYDHDTFSNFVLTTGVFVDKANTENQQGNFRYGLGVQVPGDSFYAFLVSAKEQNWQVTRGTLTEGAVTGDSADLTVIESGIETSIRVATEQEEDRLTVIANGTDLMYYVNGNLVYVLTVEDHQKVKVGFVVETLADVTRVHIHFNWIRLLNIEPFES